MTLNERINARGFAEYKRALPLAQALFDMGYERRWRAARRRAEDYHRNCRHIFDRMGVR